MPYRLTYELVRESGGPCSGLNWRTCYRADSARLTLSEAARSWRPGGLGELATCRPWRPWRAGDLAALAAPQIFFAALLTLSIRAARTRLTKQGSLHHA